MAGVMAEVLAKAGNQVTIVTPQASTASFTQFTLELDHIHRRLAALGVIIIGYHAVSGIGEDSVELKSIHGGPARSLPCASVVMVAGMAPNDSLVHEIKAGGEGPRIVAFGDCLAPSIIATAVYGGHRFARNLDMSLAETADFQREDIQAAYAVPDRQAMAGD